MTVGGMIVVALLAIGLAITFMTARLAERSYTARGVALRLVAALFLTVPVCVAAAKLVDGNVSDAFLYAFLAISFMLAILLQWVIEGEFRRRLVRRRTYAPRTWQSESLASKETRHETPWVTVGRTSLDLSSHSPESSESEDVVLNEIRQVALLVAAESTPLIDQRSEVQGTALAIPRLREAKEEPKEEPKEELKEEPREELKEEPISRNDALNRALRKLQNDSPGVEAATLILEDGLMIASLLAPHTDESRVAGMTAVEEWIQRRRMFLAVGGVGAMFGLAIGVGVIVLFISQTVSVKNDTAAPATAIAAPAAITKKVPPPADAPKVVESQSPSLANKSDQSPQGEQ